MTKKRAVFDWAFAIVAALSVGSAAYVLHRDGTDVARAILVEDLELFATILPKVAAGCLIGAFVRLLVPREVIVRWVGEGSGLRGIVIATAVGAIFPGGPFTIFPLAGAFMLSGADRGSAVAFVIGWLLLGVNRAIIWEAPFFGTDFVLLRFAISVAFPVLAGLLARNVDRLWSERAGQPIP
ncbi:MAG: permease [Beijerinckiaceae bacterium]